MLRQKLEPKGSIQLQNAGVFSALDLTTGAQNKRLLVEVRAVATVANQDGGALVVNRGSVLAAIQCAISEGGFDTWQQIDPRIARFMTSLMSAAPLTQRRTRRLTPADAQTDAAVNLVEQFTIDFGNPRGVSWRETAYIEANSAQRFQLRAQLLNGAARRLLDADGGTTTLVLSEVEVEVFQDYAISEPGLPYFKPLWRTMSVPVPSANQQLRELVLTNHRLRGIIIQQDTGLNGEVSDIINRFTLRGDQNDIIGPNQIEWDRWRAFHETLYGAIDTQVGAISGDDYNLDTTPGYGLVDFSPEGRISSYAFPNKQFNNLRFEFDCQASASGATDSMINIVLLEMSRPTSVAGKEMVTAELPSFAM